MTRLSGCLTIVIAAAENSCQTPLLATTAYDIHTWTSHEAQISRGITHFCPSSRSLSTAPLPCAALTSRRSNLVLESSLWHMDAGKQQQLGNELSGVLMPQLYGSPLLQQRSAVSARSANAAMQAGVDQAVAPGVALDASPDHGADGEIVIGAARHVSSRLDCAGKA